MRLISYVDVKKSCEVCSKEFIIRQNNQTCCSKSCRQKRDYPKTKEVRLLQSRKWYKDNSGKIREQRKERYLSDPGKFKQQSKAWRLANPDKVRENNRKYKDKIRHGNKRQELIKTNGLKCSECGKDGNPFKIVAHHVTFNNQDHSQQVLLCRACHCRLHHSNEKKPITAEQINEAIESSSNLFEACKKLGLNRSSLYQKRKKLNLL